MKNIIKKILSGSNSVKQTSNHQSMSYSLDSLAAGKIDTEYTIKGIETEDLEMKNFLFTLGCYEGEHVTIISRLSENIVIAVKDARYSIDSELASAIII